MKKSVKKEWFLDRYCGRQFAALVEDGKLTEFFSEREPRTNCVGNIYKGKVVNVVAGMNAAFINCGMKRNCYLALEDDFDNCAKYDGTMDELNTQKTQLKEGDEVIVQVVQAARGNKGAKVTTHLSFVGKQLIYLPNTSFVGISRKITDEQTRADIFATVEKFRVSLDEGFIIRTKAPFATQKQLKVEVDYLKKLSDSTFALAKTAPVGALLYEDEDLPHRVLRDVYGEELTAMHVGDKELYERLLRLIKLRKDIPEKKLVFYTGERAMLTEYDIMPLVYATATPKVPLENGGSLVIEHTEAMTVIDVNTGSFVGNTNLEETVFRMNLEAAREIARQVRLRNIGGIVVVDFIDMTEEAHREAVTEELKAHLALDTTKTNVLPMSELCLSQFTRKRVGNEMHSYLVKPCSCCGGVGHVPEDIFVITRLRSAILDCFADGYTSAIIDLNENVMKKILSEGIFSIEAKNRWRKNRIYFIPHKTYKEECFSVRGENEKILVLPNNAQLLY